MSSFFGEIVEPSTRALIDEDLEEYPEYLEILPAWVGNDVVPENINSLIFLESKIVNDLALKCIIEGEPTCRFINGGIDIFKLSDNKYLVLYTGEQNLNPAQVVGALEKWIFVAKNINIITTDSIYNYKNTCGINKPNSLIRVLTNSEKTVMYNKLEQPNLVTGLGASILSFCIHLGLNKCTLFIIYMDMSPGDPYSSGTILEVFKKMSLPVRNCSIKTSLSSSNLYM